MLQFIINPSKAYQVGVLPFECSTCIHHEYVESQRKNHVVVVTLLKFYNNLVFNIVPFASSADGIRPSHIASWS